MINKKAIYQALALAVIAIAIVAIMVLASRAEQLRQRKTSQANSVFWVDAPPCDGKCDITWSMREPVGHPFLPSQDNRRIVFYTENYKQIVVICDVIDWENRKRDKVETIVTPETPVPNPVPPGPVPPEPVPPGPDPIPDGFPGEVYRRAVAVNLPDECLRIAANMEGVSSRIAAGGFTKVAEIQAEMTRVNRESHFNSEAWKDFATWMGEEFNQRATGIPETKQLIDDVVVGLNAAGAKR